jgi:hypothetical protein
MGWFRKKPDPISDRARALTGEIAALEAQIKKLDSQLVGSQLPPRPRTPAVSSSVGGNVPETPAPNGVTSSGPAQDEPIFESVGVNRLKNRVEPQSTPEHYNELGVRKYDLPALLRRWRNHFRGPATSNPKLVSYLAAGGIQGLRPLRYEKRVARNRFIALVIILLMVLLGLIAAFVNHPITPAH